MTDIRELLDGKESPVDENTVLTPGMFDDDDDTKAEEAPDAGTSLLGAIDFNEGQPEAADPVDAELQQQAEEVAVKLSGTETAKSFLGGELLAQVIEQAAGEGIESMFGYFSRIADSIAVITLTLDGEGDVVTAERHQDAADGLVSAEEQATWSEKRYRLISLKDLTGPRAIRMIKVKQAVTGSLKAYRQVNMSLVELAEDLYMDQQLTTEFLASAYGPVGEKYRYEEMQVIAAKLQEAITLEMVVGVLYRFFSLSGLSKLQGACRTYLGQLIQPLMNRLRETGPSTTV